MLPRLYGHLDLGSRLGLVSLPLLILRRFPLILGKEMSMFGSRERVVEIAR